MKARPGEEVAGFSTTSIPEYAGSASESSEAGAAADELGSADELGAGTDELGSADELGAAAEGLGSLDDDEMGVNVGLDAGADGEADVVRGVGEFDAAPQPATRRTTTPNMANN